MATMTGLSERSRGERHADKLIADEERAEIAAAEHELREYIAAWARRHEGDAGTLAQLEDFLSDYFHERRRWADQQELGW